MEEPLKTETAEPESSEVSARERILLLLNPKAGRGKTVEVLGSYLPPLAEDGSPVTVYFTQREGDLTDYVMREGKNYDRVIAAGGDGTLNELVTGYIKGGLENNLGYLPTGTVCDFANTLGISMDLREAAAGARHGKTREYDAGLLNGEQYFAYVASFGAFTESSYDTPTELKNNLGKLAYLLNALKNLNTIRPIRIKMQCGPTIYEGNVLLGAVSNTTQMGGILRFDPEAIDMSDGKFEILLVRYPENAGDMTTLAAAVRTQDYSSEMFIFGKADKVSFTFAEDVAWTIDGEFGGNFRGCDIEILPKAWRLTH